MELAPIMEQYRDRVIADSQFQRSATFQNQKQALNAIVSCRTEGLGEIQVYCPECDEVSWFYHSCGHRSCPKCQNHETSRWLNRQRKKLLPVDYFQVTFTLPAELRLVAKCHPKVVYDLMFAAASVALQQSALDPKFCRVPTSKRSLHSNKKPVSGP